MPERKTLRRAARDKEEGKAPSTQAGEFVKEEIEHIREHQRRRKKEGKTFRPDTLRPVNDE